MVEKIGLPKPVLYAIIAAILAVAGFVIFRSVAPRPIETNPDPPEIVWLKQKSKEAGGDWSKLSPQEQERANTATTGRGATSVGIYGGKAPTETGH